MNELCGFHWLRLHFGPAGFSAAPETFFLPASSKKCPMDKDLNIIARIRAGKVGEYRLLVDRHKDRAMTLAVRLLGSREEAEEAVQDAFLRAWHSLGDFRGESRFSTWLYRILYNLCMTRVSRRPARTDSLDEPDAIVACAAVGDDSETMVLDRIDRHETMALVAEELTRLPANYQTVLSLFYLQEQSYDEIACVLGLPLGTVKTHLFRARTLLRTRVLQRTTKEVHAA